ncbi:MAG: hypothetical protein H0T84_02175 [Tatlockia sp.]|nr:hypothetical protein [Tatlockia sp.]
MQTSNQVIEAMNDTPSIQINSLLEFKLRTVYWGSRYGISDRGEHGTKILNEANFQRGLCPIYTMTAAYEPGTGYDDEGKPTHCAVFRCDTFVSYVFHVAGYDLPTYNSFTLPVTVFSAFPKGHGDGPLAQNSQLLAKQVGAMSSSLSINKVESAQLAEMDFEEFMAIIDLPVKKATKETLDKAWKFAQDPVLGAEKQTIIVDYLGLAGTVDFIPKFIDLYSKIDNEELKSMLIRSTFTLHQKYSWLKDYPQERAMQQQFYAGLLNKNLPARDSELVLRGFMNLSSTDELHSKIDNLSAIINNDTHNLNANIGLWIELAMKSKELEQRSIPEIISILNRENKPDLDDLFNQFIVRRLSKLGVDALEPESKKQISTYLQSVSFLYNQNSMKAMTTGLNAPYYGAWLEATALVNSKTLKDAANFVVNFIQDKSLKEQVNFISGLSNSAYMKKAFQTEPLLMKFKKENNAI